MLLREIPADIQGLVENVVALRKMEELRRNRNGHGAVLEFPLYPPLPESEKQEVAKQC